MIVVPLTPVPSQRLSIVLGGQDCQIAVYQKDRGIFIDINSNGIDIANGILALDTVPIVNRLYLGFIGNFYFIDTQGFKSPEYSGLGDRWLLIYLSQEEVDVIV